MKEAMKGRIGFIDTAGLGFSSLCITVLYLAPFAELNGVDFLFLPFLKSRAHRVVYHTLLS